MSPGIGTVMSKIIHEYTHFRENIVCMSIIKRIGRKNESWNLNNHF